MEFVKQTRFHEDGSCYVKARIMAPDATGDTARDGEGYALKRADLSSISLSVYDINDGGSTLISGPTSVTVSSAIVDALVTTAALWGVDAYGYNFAYTLPPASFPTGGNKYRAEFKFTTTGGAVGWLKIEGEADKVYTS
mgnify:CR=1 FL=1